MGISPPEITRLEDHALRQRRHASTVCAGVRR
nr:hypothetical protein [Cronobacter turicensis]